MDISGRWQCVLDEQDRAKATLDWSSPEVKLVTLPGSTDLWQLGKPDAPGIVNRLSRKHRYEGAVWLRREVMLPKKSKSQLYRLSLERTHWKVEAWLDDTLLGEADSLSAPNRFWLPDDTKEGIHTLTLRIDNRMIVNIGNWAHAVTDETQTNWNGVIGKMLISSVPKCSVSRVAGNLLAQESKFTITVSGENRTGTEQTAELRIEGRAIEGRDVRITLPAGIWKQQVSLRTSRGFKLWDEFSPNLCQISVSLVADGIRHDSKFMVLNRRIEADGHQLRLNGRALKLRGTLDCAIWPQTGYPPMDKRSWKDYLNKLRRFGVNHVRFHSWCPPEAAFQAADELGLILQIELPLWLGLGQVGQDPLRADFLKREASRILVAYGQHPSFCLLSMGNELGDGKEEFLDELIKSCRSVDPDKLYTRHSGFGIDGLSDDYMVNAGLPTGAVRGGIGSSTMDDFRMPIEGCSKPVISHEVGQYSMYADYSEISQYKGVLAPDNLITFQKSAEQTGVLDQAQAFLQASGKFAMLLYKDEYEKAFRTPNLAGFQSLGLQDFPGQGSTMVGLFNSLMQSKQVITPVRHREFFSATVPLVRIPKRVFVSGERLVAKVELSHYGASDLTSELVWHCGEKSGHFKTSNYATGQLNDVGKIDLKLPNYTSARRLELTVEDSLGRFRNSWGIWVLPRVSNVMQIHSGITITQSVTEAIQTASTGGRVLLCLPESQVSGETPGSFFPVFWNMRLFAQQPGTMGMLIQYKHPALRLFPTLEHSDWQWEDLNVRSRPMDITGMPRELKPIVQVIDDFGRNTRLADIFEAKLGQGRIVACSMDISTDLPVRPTAGLLLQSLLDYISSNRFEPEVTITVEQLKALSNEGQVSRYQKPAGLETAAFWVKAGQTAPMGASVPWSTQLDQAVTHAQGYDYLWQGANLWHDGVGSSWHGNDMTLRVTIPVGTKGTLWLHLHDWNAQSRKCHLFIEGRDSGSFSRQTGSGLWVNLPFTETDSADQLLEVWTRSESGPNAQVTQFAVIPE